MEVEAAKVIAATNASDESLTFLKFMNRWTVLNYRLFDSIKLRKLAPALLIAHEQHPAKSRILCSVSI